MRKKMMKMRGKRKTVRLICAVCKKDWAIRTDSPELYTEEVRKNWVCLICESKGEKGWL